ncbi:family 20 glycosylhydrolase [bacterium]|nr:family 20 glycosylhydrolase [bacterium]
MTSPHQLVAAIIPQPLRVTTIGRTFLMRKPVVYTEDFGAAADRLVTWLQRASGTPVQRGRVSTSSNIVIERHPVASDEAYELAVYEGGARIRARHPDGVSRAIATLQQLFPPAFHQPGGGKFPVELPQCWIEDQPRFPWRGLLLDCSRHFMTVDYILDLLDAMAAHKMNVFHWHLVDDQAWRLQIDRYPLLTEVAAWRVHNGVRHGGFYAKDDVRRIVAHAASLGIRVVPEIELPGHANAALNAYPHFACRGEVPPIEPRWGVYPDIFCAGLDDSLQFYRDVMEEVIELFPDRFIHIGGDEAPRDRWKECPRCQARIAALGLKDEAALQTWMTREIQTFVAARGKAIIGWDELQYGGLPPDSILQHWRYEECLAGAIAENHQVIISQNRHLYFDYPHDKDPRVHSRDTQRNDWMPALGLEKVYGFDPIGTLVPAEKANLVLGMECTLWSEFAPQELVHRQLFPRICAVSEIAWSSPRDRSFAEFSKRLDLHLLRLKAMGITPYDGPMASPDWQQIYPTP